MSGEEGIDLRSCTGLTMPDNPRPGLDQLRLLQRMKLQWEKRSGEGPQGLAPLVEVVAQVGLGLIAMVKDGMI